MTATLGQASRAAPPGEPVIVTQALHKTYRRRGYPDVRAVESLALTVRPGEIFGLLGPNGAGKTTTIGMLTTRVVPTSGRAHVAGVDVVANPARTKQHIGVVPQTNTLDRSISVYENLYYHGRYFGLSRTQSGERSRRLLDRFRLAGKADVLVDELSGGMAQRLMLARALLHAPAVLFCDEPTTGLDPQSRIAFWELLGELHAEGQTILLTTHYMEEADQLCERLAIMDHGRILALDSPAALKRAVDADTVVRLSVDRTRCAGHEVMADLAGRLAVIPGVRRTAVVDGAVEAATDGVAGLLPRLLAQADAAGTSVTDVAVRAPTLETVFIALTGKQLRE